MQKNILLIVQNNSFPFDKRVYREAKTLKDSGNNVYVISPKTDHDSKDFEIIDEISVFRYKDYVADGGIKGYLVEYLNSVLKIFIISLKLIITDKIQIIHVANPPDFFWPLAVVSKLFGVKFIYDQHDLSPEMSNSKFDNKFLFKLLQLNEKLSVKFSNGIIVVNKTFKERLIDKWNIKPEKCAVVYNGPPKDFLPIKNDELVEKYENRKVVLYVGLMTVNDHIEVIVEAANELINNRDEKDLQFILVGDGDVRKQMEDLSERYGIRDKVEFTGIVDHTKVKEYLYVADVCIAPDKPNNLNEYLTLVKVLEYMKSSKAFVSFKLQETMEFAGEAGMYAKDEADFANKIQELIDNPKLEEEKGKLGNKIITDNYLWSHSEVELLKLYNSI